MMCTWYFYCLVTLLCLLKNCLVLFFRICLTFTKPEQFQCYLEYDNSANIELSHTVDLLNLDVFSYRGNITIANLDIGLARTTQESFTDDQRSNLRSLAEDQQLYRLKAEVVYANGKRKNFLSATSACNLIEAQLNDALCISVDNSGYVNAVTVLTTGSANCLKEEMSTLASKDLNTDVIIRHVEVAPLPDTTTFIQKIEREARERGEIRDNRGFFAKYWMYIVPVVLLLFISGATNQDASK